MAVLVTLGVMTKNNELVAFKAGGVSLYRISLPLLLAGLALATGLVVLDDTYLPYANQRQDALRNQIKGRPAQTYYQPSRQWIFGEKSKIYNYELFDPDRELFGGLNVFELDPATFEIRRRIYAARAHWDTQQKIWILESGWVREFDHGQVSRYQPFLANAMKELDEPPSYFNREVRQSYQMTWWELQRYIGDLAAGGIRCRASFRAVAEEAFFPVDRSDYHPARHSLLDPGGNPRRRGRPGSGSGNCHCVLGGFGADRSDGRGRTIAANFGGMGARHDLRFPGPLFFPEDADVRESDWSPVTFLNAALPIGTAP